MKMKTTKFLAVLAVLAFAFAVFAVAAPSEESDATTASTWAGADNMTTLTVGDDVVTDAKEGDTLEAGKAYYIKTNMSLNMPAAGDPTSTGAVLIFLERGVDIKLTAPSTIEAGKQIFIAEIGVKGTTSSDGTLTLTPRANYASVDTFKDAWNNNGTLKVSMISALVDGGNAKAVANQALWLDTDDKAMHAEFYVDSDGYSYIGNSSNALNWSSDGYFIGTNVEVNLGEDNTPQKATFVNYTGDLANAYATAQKSGVENATQAMTLTKFTGVIEKSDAGNLKITSWESGDVDVLKITTDTATIGADIPAGSTLYIDGKAKVTTDTNIKHADGTSTAEFFNYGTISIKQDGSDYGQFTLNTTKMKNNGSINNLGKFIHTGKTIENNGKITTGNDAAGAAWTGDAGSVTNKGTFTFKETSDKLTNNIFNKASTGDIVNKNTNVVYLTGIVENDNTFGVNQTVIVTGNTTIKGDNIINGAIIVDEGATLTIVSGGSITLGTVQATLTNNGTIVVQSAIPQPTATNAGTINGIIAGGTSAGGFIQNNGTITLTDPDAGNGTTFKIGATTVAFVKNAGIITNSQGTMEIGANGSFMNLKGAVFNENSILSLGNGAVVSNAGAMSFDGTVSVAADNQYITIDDKSATITIVSLALPENGKTLTIANKLNGSARTITLSDTFETGDTATTAHKLTGLVIGTYNVPSGTPKVDNYGYFIIEGNVSYYTSTYGQSTASYTIVMSGKTFIGDLTIQEKVLLAGTAADAVAESVFAFIGEAYFMDSASATIANLALADVTGEVTVNRAQLSLTKPGSINAAMYMVSIGFDKIYHYTTLENAVAGASELGITEVTAMGELAVKSDLEIPAGLKVINRAELTIKDGSAVEVKDGAELNNLGTINVNGSLYAEDAADITGNTTDLMIVSDVKVVGEPDVLYTNLYDALAVAEAGDVVVLTKYNGTIGLTKNTTIKEGVILDTNEKDLSTITSDKHYTLTVNGALILYGGATFTDFKDVVLNGYILSDRELTYTTTGVPGAYYYDEEDDVYCIAGVKNLGDILAGGIATVGVWGDVKTSSLSFEGTVANTTVTFNNNVDVDSIIADNVKIVFATGNVIDTAITEGENILGLTGIVAAGKTVTVTIGDSFAVVGDLTTGADVPAKDFVFNIVGAIKVSGNVYAAVIVGEATTSGSFTAETTIDILGSLVASKPVTANDMSVIGTVSTTGDDGKVTIANGLNIGSLTEIIAAGADVEGAVTAEKIILFVGNTIDEKIVAEMKSTEVYVDGELWFTVYSDSAVTISKDAKLVVPVEDALAVAGTYGGLVVDKNGIISGTVTPGTPAEIDIEVTYEIYSVVILTDAGVKSVSIDGIELWNSGTNRFELPTGVKLMAGTHTVTYTMKAGYSGTPTLKTVDGTILKDYKFITSGTEDLTVNLQLNGTEPTPEPEPTPTPEEKSEWTITTILLVILVILIAVMAVIVALRLNRN